MKIQFKHSFVSGKDRGHDVTTDIWPQGIEIKTKTLCEGVSSVTLSHGVQKFGDLGWILSDVD